MLVFAWIVSIVVGVGLTIGWLAMLSLPAILKSVFIALVAASVGLMAAGVYRFLVRNLAGEKETRSEKEIPPAKPGGLNLNVTWTKATAWITMLATLALFSPKHATLMLVITFIWLLFKVIQSTLTDAVKVRAKQWLRVIGITILLTVTSVMVIKVWSAFDETTHVCEEQEKPSSKVSGRKG